MLKRFLQTFLQRYLKLNLKMSLLNQTWICSPGHNKASLLTLGCGDESEAFTSGAKQGVWAANAQKT